MRLQLKKLHLYDRINQNVSFYVRNILAHAATRRVSIHNTSSKRQESSRNLPRCLEFHKGVFASSFIIKCIQSEFSSSPSKHNWSWQDSKRGGRRYNLHGGALFMMGGRRMAQSKWPEIVGFYSSFQPGVQNGISQITWRSPNSPTVKLRCVATVPTVLEYIIRELY